MFAEILYDFKNWWFKDSYSRNDIEEFFQIESKHTRVHYDEDIYETIRVH